MFEKLLELIFPPVCGFCEQLNSEYLCSKCEDMIKPKIISEVEKPKDKHFDIKISIFSYEGDIRKEILLYKFYRKIIYV